MYFTVVIQLEVHLYIADQYQMKLSRQDYHLYPFIEYSTGVCRTI